MWPLSLDLVSARSRVLELALSSSMIEYRAQCAPNCLISVCVYSVVGHGQSPAASHRQ